MKYLSDNLITVKHEVLLIPNTLLKFITWS